MSSSGSESFFSSVSKSFFINTCNPPPTCQDNCDFNLYDNADYYSCVHGCKMFERYHYCDCETSDFKEEIFNYYNYVYQANYCNYGCQYAFDNYLGSNYSVVLNTTMPSSVLKKKHCAVSYHKNRETIAAGIVRFSHIPREMNYTDILTKPLGPNACMDLVKPLLFRNPPQE